MRYRSLAVLLLALLMCFAPAGQAQDGLDLPTELYVLRNAGIVERYGLGAAGVVPVSPEAAFVIDFAVAPDGAHLAYRTQDGLYIRDMSDAARLPYELEGPSANFPPLRGDGATVAWAPDAAVLAYTTEYGLRAAFDVGTSSPRFLDVAQSPLSDLRWSPQGTYLAAEAQNDVWWVYRREGYRLDLVSAVPSSVGIAWVDDARLILTPREGGLYLLDLANANAQTELQPGPRQYRLPALRLDGTLAVFTRLPDEPGIGEMGAFLQTLTLDLATPAAEPLTTSEIDVDLTGMRWAPRGALLMAFRGGSLTLVQPGQAQGFPLPLSDAVSFGWGPTRPVGQRGLPVASTVTFRAADSFGVFQVWRLPADGSDRQQMTFADSSVRDYAVSRDERMLVYASGNSLWRLDLTTPDAEPVELTKVSETADGLAFSADGSFVYYTTSGAAGGGLYTVSTQIETDADGLPLLNVPQERLLDDTTTRYRSPLPAPNVDALLLRVLRDDSADLALFDRGAETLLTIGAYDVARWTEDGRLLVLTVGDDSTTISLVDPAQEPIMPLPLYVAPTGERVHDVALIDDGATLRLINGPVRPYGPAPLSVIDVPITGGSPALAAELGFITAPRLGPGGEVVVGLTAQDGRLMQYTVSNGQRSDLVTPSVVRDFRWSFVFSLF